MRGFAVKLYTKQGNWDIVGNNIPVFFIQDPIKFPDLIHAAKAEPDRGFPQAQTAHDNFWDFASLMPESTHMLLWAMSDRAIPRSFRFMQGFGVHTFRFVNEAGESTFVKFHWKPKLGMQSVLWDEAVKINGADPDFHRRDLWDSVTTGDLPEWELCVQAFDDEFADAFEFDVLDPTKLIPEEVLPAEPIGRLVLDRVVDNFFAETEQVAFCTQNIVPGVDFTNDPLLQGRNFSYLDTQLKRLGGPNFTYLPVNAPKCPMHSFQQDGHMAMANPTGRVNLRTELVARPTRRPRRGFSSYAAEEGGDKRGFGPSRSPTTTARPRSSTEVRPPSSNGTSSMRSRSSCRRSKRWRSGSGMVGNLRNVDDELASAVATGLGMAELPDRSEAACTPVELDRSPSLSILANAPGTFAGRKLGVIVTDGARAATLKVCRPRPRPLAQPSKSLRPPSAASRSTTARPSPHNR